MRFVSHTNAASTPPRSGASTSPGLLYISLQRLKAASGGAAEIAARIGVAIWRFWEVYGYLREGREWLEQILSNGDSLTPLLREQTFSALGVIEANQGDFIKARRAYEAGLALARKSPSSEYVGTLHMNLAQLAIEQGEYAYGRELLEEGLEIIRKEDWKVGLAFCLDHLGLIEANMGNYTQANSFYRESLLIRLEIGDHMFTGMTLCNLGDLARYQGEQDQAADLYMKGLDLFRELGDQRSISYALARLALVEMCRGNYEHSRALQEEGLSPMKEIQDKEMVAFSLAGFAALEAMQGRIERAISLFAQAETLLESIATIMRPAERSYFERIMATVNTFLEQEDYAIAQAEGRAMPLERAIKYALDEV